MNTTTNTRRATGKATREHVLRLARNLPLAKSVLASCVLTICVPHCEQCFSAG